MRKITTVLFLSWQLMAFADLPITLEHAITSEQVSWGFMQRSYIPENHGMLFHYKQASIPSIWSFNCLLDLSVAFLDQNGTIQDIKPLYAHYEKMDPRRPVKNLHEMWKYPVNDPIIKYFLQRAVRSDRPCLYVLEMNIGWFDKNGVKKGDRLIFEPMHPRGVIRRCSSEKASAS